MQYGSLGNLIMANVKPAVPEVGMGATEIGYTDRHAGTIVGVSKNKVAWARDIATPKHVPPTEAQEWAYARDPNAKPWIYTKRKNGAYVRQGQPMRGGSRLLIGVRDEYYDYSF